MIIDLILDRAEAAEKYSALKFYYAVREYQDIWPEITAPILRAFRKSFIKGNSDKEIKKALCQYVDDNGYNPQIKVYINLVSWK